MGRYLPVARTRILASDIPRRNGLTANLYRVLGLRPNADSSRIKAAYRTLAKRFHPDINSGDRAAGERIREINRAYQTLGNPQARAAYDAASARERATARKRFLQGAAAGTAAFIITLSLVPLAAVIMEVRIVRLQLPHGAAPGAALTSTHAQPSSLTAGDGPNGPQAAASAQYSPQAASKRAAAAVLSGALPRRGPTLREAERPRSAPLASTFSGQEAGWDRPSKDAPAQRALLLELSGASRTPPASPQAPWPSNPPGSALQLPRQKPAIWRRYRNARSGFALTYPADLFTEQGVERDNDDRILFSDNGRAVLRISSQPHGPTLSRYRRALMAERYAGASFDYTPVGRDWFVLSGTVGEEMFYERVTFSCNRRSHGWLMVYPAAERSFFDPVVEEINRSYRSDIPPGARCPITPKPPNEVQRDATSATAPTAPRR